MSNLDAFNAVNDTQSLSLALNDTKNSSIIENKTVNATDDIPYSNTIYVSTAGNDGWDGMNPVWNGTSGPKRTIKNATCTVNEGGTVIIAEGVYSEQDIPINNKMILKGESKENTIIDAEEQGRIFSISGSEVTIQSLTLMNGEIQDDEGGAVLNNDGCTLSLNHCILTNNAVVDSVGGSISNHGNLIINSCIFKNNTVFISIAPEQPGEGGAIYSSNNLIINNSTFIENNVMGFGGAICNDGTATIKNSVFRENMANERGGSICNQGVLTFNDNSIEESGTMGKGGGIFNTGELNMARSSIVKNFAADGYASKGGAIFNEKGTINIINSTLRDNKATNGEDGTAGAIYSIGGVIDIRGGMVLNNLDDTLCGGIYLENTKASLYFNRIFGNNHHALYYKGFEPVNAQNNWWGSNKDPKTVPGTIGGDVNLVNVSPWLVLKLTADPETVKQGGTSSLTADLTWNSDNQQPAGGYIPDGTPVKFTTNIGNIGSREVIGYTVNGIATTVLKADEGAGLAKLTALLDDQTVQATVNIQGNSTSKKVNDTKNNAGVGMQKAGLPLIGLILGILMILGCLARI